MSNEDTQDRGRELRERIVSLMQATSQAVRKPIPRTELQQLKTAASRLDQMLKAAAEADQETLRTAVARLNQLLIDIREGKDVSPNLKRRRT